MRCGIISLFVLAGSLAVGSPAYALSIVPQFLSATTGPDNDPSLGGGNLQDVFAAAADIWEAAIVEDRTVTIPFQWTTSSFALAFTDGTSVFVSRDTDWFIDPTPTVNEEYASPTSGTAVIGGIAVNYNVGFSGGSGAVVGYDLLSVLIHEIGHVLANADPVGSAAEFADGEVNVTSPLPLAGLALPAPFLHLDTPAGYTGPFPVMFPFFDVTERRFISNADLLFVAQAGGWQQIDTSRFTAVPEPGTLTLLAFSGAALAWRRRSIG